MNTMLKKWTPDEVQRQATYQQQSVGFAGYAQQRLGMPNPTMKDMVIMRKKLKELKDTYPHANWKTMCKLVDYAKARKKRPPRVYMIADYFREAWAAGFAPELDFDYKPAQPKVDDQLTAVLQNETHPGWRRRLVMAQTVETKEKVLAEWKRERSASYPVLSVPPA